MTTREFYLQRRQAELSAFLKVLKALPKEQLSYKPAERSPSAEQLVWTITNELKLCLDVVKENKAEWKTIPPPPLDEMLVMFERCSNELSERVTKLDEAAWDRSAQFYYNGKVVSEQPVGFFL